MELFADKRGKGARGRADAADLPTRVEVVGTLHHKVLWRHLRGCEHFERQHRRVLRIRRTKDHPLGTRIIADLSFFFENSAAFVLPPAGNIIDVIQSRALQHQGQCHPNLLSCGISCPRHSHTRSSQQSHVNYFTQKKDSADYYIKIDAQFYLISEISER
jgi:hypothetical protein